MRFSVSTMRCRMSNCALRFLSTSASRRRTASSVTCAACFWRRTHLQGVLLDGQVAAQDGQLVVQGHQLVVGVGDLGHQVGHHEAPAFGGGQVTHLAAFLGVAELSRCPVPRGAGTGLESGERLRKAWSSAMGRLCSHGAVPGVFAHLPTGGCATSTKGRYSPFRARPGGHFPWLEQDVELLVVASAR